MEIQYRNAEMVAWRAFRGQEVTPLHGRRLHELTTESLKFESRDPQLFWGVFFPSLGYGAGFSNGEGDGDRSLARRTYGYGELSVGTARYAASLADMNLPSGDPELRRFLVYDWRANLRLTWAYMNYLSRKYDGDQLKVLNSYQMGEKGHEQGRWGLKYRQLSVREHCLNIQRKIQGGRR